VKKKPAPPQKPVKKAPPVAKPEASDWLERHEEDSDTKTPTGFEGFETTADQGGNDEPIEGFGDGLIERHDQDDSEAGGEDSTSGLIERLGDEEKPTVGGKADAPINQQPLILKEHTKDEELAGTSEPSDEFPDSTYDDAQKRAIIRRLLIRVLPQVLLLIALIVGGRIIIQAGMFQGEWNGTVSDEFGGQFEIEMRLDRYGNHVEGVGRVSLEGDGSYLVKRVRGERCPIEGKFDRRWVELSVYHPGLNELVVIELRGSFNGRDRAYGTVYRDGDSVGVFELRRKP
jgi:hypothetical protein